MARISVAVQRSVPSGISDRASSHYTQDANGGTFDLGTATGIAFNAVEADIQAALDGEYNPNDYLVTGDADDFIVVATVVGQGLILDGTALTLTASTPTVTQQQTAGGIALDASAGAMFPNNGACRVLITNNGAGAHVVTFVSPQTILGLAVADLPFTVPAGASMVVGPFSATTFNQRSGADKGKVYVNASGTQSEVTIAPFTD